MKGSNRAIVLSLKGILLSSLLIAPCVAVKVFAAGHTSAENVKIDPNDIKSAPIVTNNHDGTQFLEQMTTRVKQLGAYKFDGLLGTLKERDIKVDAGAFYYMPSSLLRVEVKGGGYKSGSILIKQRNGTIRAKGGPSLLGMKMNLQPDSNMLKLPNGLNIVDCDYLSLLLWLRSQMGSGQKIYSSDGPMTIASQVNRVVVLEVRDTNNGVLIHRILVDPQLLVPVEWDIFKEGKFFSTVRFENFQLCPTMDESFFHI